MIEDFIRKVAREKNWPLEGISTQRVRDAEINNWEYTLVTLKFNSSFEEADNCLHKLYPELDSNFKGDLTDIYLDVIGLN